MRKIPVKCHYGGTEKKPKCENNRSTYWFRFRLGRRQQVKEKEEGGVDIGSCCTGSSSPIDVSMAYTHGCSTSYQHRWAARSVPQQEKYNTTVSLLLSFLLHISHKPWPPSNQCRVKLSHWLPLWRMRKIKHEKQIWSLWDSEHGGLYTVFLVLPGNLAALSFLWAYRENGVHLPLNNGDGWVCSVRSYNN